MKIFTYLILLCSLCAYSQDMETISWAGASMNDRIALTISYKEFQKMGRKADSLAVATPQDICGMKNMEGAQLLYFKGIKYLFKNDTLTFRGVDFSKRKFMYLATKDDWFDHSTTFKAFAKAYPGSAAYPDYSEDEDGNEYEMYTMLPDDDTDASEWRFYFTNGKLHHIDYWTPCE
ncbi:hypothetical protein [Flavobacterium akiainvivens]|nr:hypothetical protein [Flavobacterium akiainvivens]